jgi:hypothetical protein
MQNFLSALRALLILVGSYLVGHNLFGAAVNSQTWEVISGAIITVATMIWGVATKTSTIEGIESAARSVITSVGGLLTSSGVLTGDNLNAILGLVTAILPAIQSSISASKNSQVASGAVTISPITNQAVTKTPAIGSSAVPDPNKKSL